jgi:hypothetical protein
MRLRRDGAAAALCLILVLASAAPSPSPAQTTQGLIAGRVFDAESGEAVHPASIEYSRWEGTRVVAAGSARVDEYGLYAFPSLPPGTYQLRVCAAECPLKRDAFPRAGEYQPQEIYALELLVASRLEVNFALRKLTNVWEAGLRSGLYQDTTTAILHYYAADAAQLRSAYIQLTPYRTNSLAATVSYVVDGSLIDYLPLAGRDVYTALVLEPGVTAATATARGLGLSVNGQRPTVSSYLLDGLENNNALVTGPLTTLASEMVQEYRISTSLWSAEYGGTAGFLANAVTRAGGTRWHGQAYFDLVNDALNANTFEDNARGLPRLPFKQTEYGFQAGGPIWKHSIFLSAALDVYRSRGYQDPENLTVTSPQFINQLGEGTLARSLLTQFPTPATDPGDGTVSPINVRPTVSLDRDLSLLRGDYVQGRHRLMVRTAVNRFDWPDFVWYPYKDFISGLTQPLAGVAIGYTLSVRPNLTQELHAGWSRNTVRWDRAHPEIPTLVVMASTVKDQPAPLLPGSPAFYAFRDTDHNFQANDTWTWLRGRHIVKTGGGLLARTVTGNSTVGRDGQVTFDNIIFFEISAPESYTTALSRLSLPQFQQPAFDRAYRNTEWFAFAEDTWRATPRIVLNAGIRAEGFGAPSNTGAAKDAMVRLGTGSNFPERVVSASLILPASGDQRLWTSGENVAPRFGFAWDSREGGPVVRGGYGIFFDRPFDNVWRNMGNNNLVLPPALDCGTACGRTDANPAGYLAPPATLLALLQGQPFVQDFPKLTLIDPGLRAGYTQSYFLGLEQRLWDSWTLELNGLGALGRRLLTTDVVNRHFSTTLDRYNSSLPDILWRSSQGDSNYDAVTAIARYRSRRGSLQLSYTWSHYLDNQSDPLAGDFFDLSFVNTAAAGNSSAQGAFTRQFDSHGDHANSDFDQRHNLVFYSWWNAPAPTGPGWLTAISRGWRFAEMAAFRTGFPYTVRSGSTGALLNQRANIIDPSRIDAPAGSAAAPGAVAVLNPAAFQAPLEGVLGNSGRNAFRGPGLWNIDLSLSRSFAVPKLGESRRLWLRADFFNAFNHANLDNPDPVLGSPTFGQASRGRLDYNTGFPASVPLRETPRQIQFIVKLEF